MASTVASWQEGPRYDSWLEQDLSMWSLHVLPVFVWVFSRCSSFPNQQNMYVGLSLVSTLDQGPDCKLWLPTAPHGLVMGEMQRTHFTVRCICDQ